MRGGWPGCHTDRDSWLALRLEGRGGGGRGLGGGVPGLNVVDSERQAQPASEPERGRGIAAGS